MSNLAATISNNKIALFLLDSMEEFRDLSLEEWNFRKLVQEHLENLLEKQRIYWKQRGQIKWATLGEENTKFFHANASIKNNKNSIMSLKDSDGMVKTKHEDKAEILWQAFRERLGTSEFSQMHFNLSELIQEADKLEDLVNPFTTEETDSIIKNLPLGKSPGPDGFNSDFIKKCWGVIAKEFYDVCNGFYNE
jgi:hypothetical protein